MESLRQPLLSIRRRWLLIAEITALAILVAVVVTLTRGSSWVSNATVIVGSAQDAGRTPSDNAVLARGYVDLFNSPGYQSTVRAGTNIPADLRVLATPVAASPLINIAGSAASPQTAQRGTNAMAAAFVADIQRGYARISNARLAPLQTRLATVGAEISERKARLRALVGTTGPATDAERAQLAGELTQLQAERTALTAELQGQISPVGNPNAVGLLHAAGRAAEGGPSLPRNAVLGLIGGLALGCAVALFLGAREGELASESRVQERLGLRLLATVPAGTGAVASRQRRRELRALANAVAFSRSPPVSVVVTSADSEAGKGLVARGLADAWAEGGARVTLVQADTAPLRAGSDRNGGAPAMLRRRLARGDGAGSAPAEAEPGPNLTVVAAPAGDAATLASAGNGLVSDAIVEGAGARMRFMVINAPPLLRAPLDAGVEAARRDGAILVVDAVRTRTDAAMAARDALRRAEATVLGVVLVEPPATGLDAVRAVLPRRS